MSRDGAYFTKDEMIKLHKMLWEIKIGLESSGLKFNLSKYKDFDIPVGCTRIKSSSHWQAISLLAETLAGEAVRLIRQKM